MTKNELIQQIESKVLRVLETKAVGNTLNGMTKYDVSCLVTIDGDNKTNIVTQPIHVLEAENGNPEQAFLGASEVKNYEPQAPQLSIEDKVFGAYEQIKLADPGAKLVASGIITLAGTSNAIYPIKYSDNSIKYYTLVNDILKELDVE